MNKTKGKKEGLAHVCHVFRFSVNVSSFRMSRELLLRLRATREL